MKQYKSPKKGNNKNKNQKKDARDRCNKNKPIKYEFYKKKNRGSV